MRRTPPAGMRCVAGILCVCETRGGWKSTGTEKASAAKARGVGDGKRAAQPFSRGE